MIKLLLSSLKNQINQRIFLPIFRKLVFLTKFGFILSLITIAGIAVDIFWSKTSFDIFTLFIIFCWILATSYRKLGATYSYIFSFFLLFSAQIFLLNEQNPIIKKASSERMVFWAYLFIATGLIQEMIIKKTDSDDYKIMTDTYIYLTGTIAKESKYLLFVIKQIYRNNIPVNENFAFTLLRAGTAIFKIIYFLIIRMFINLKKLSIVIYKYFVIFLKNARKSLWKIILTVINSRFAGIIKKGIVFAFVRYPVVFIACFAMASLKILREINFYRKFFNKEYMYRFYILSGRSIIFVVVIFAFLFIFIKTTDFFFKIFLNQFKANKIYLFVQKVLEKLKNKNWVVISFLMFLFIFVNNTIFMQARNQFEFYPYILRIFVGIGSTWQQVDIYGYNFKELPFVGKVLINGEEQIVESWSDNVVTIVIDPVKTKSGELVVVNNYGFGNNIQSNKVKFNYYSSKTASLEDSKKFWDELKKKAIIESYYNSLDEKLDYVRKH